MGLKYVRWRRIGVGIVVLAVLVAGCTSSKSDTPDPQDMKELYALVTDIAVDDSGYAWPYIVSISPMEGSTPTTGSVGVTVTNLSDQYEMDGMLPSLFEYEWTGDGWSVGEVVDPP